MGRDAGDRATARAHGRGGGRASRRAGRRHRHGGRADDHLARRPPGPRPRRPRAVLPGAALARRRRRMTARLAELSVAEVRAVLAGREATAVEITEACLEALAARNPRVRAFLIVTADDALAAARAADAAL